MSQLYLRSVRVRPELPEDVYYSHIPLVRCLLDQPLELKKPVTFLVGENGSGKSTLMEAIAASMGFNAEGGSRNLKFSTRDTHSGLYEYLVCAKGAHARDGFFSEGGELL